MNQLIAKYYKADGQVAIYDENILQAKLVEFPLQERGAWGLPPLDEWKKTDFGYEISFRYEVAG